MANFVNKYTDRAAYKADATKQYPNVSLLADTKEVVYARNRKIDYSEQYFTTVALSDGYIIFDSSITGGSSSTANLLSYSTDEGQTWTTMISQTVRLPVNDGDRVFWKGEATPYGNSGIGRFNNTYVSETSADFNVEGNAMSLLYGDNFQGQTDLTRKDSAFSNLFSGNTHVLSAENLSLPAMTLANNCYYQMFISCKNLQTAPQLPATTLAEQCYSSMFANCTSLTVGPKIGNSSTVAATSACTSMFSNCTSLTTAPELPAMTLAGGCYQYMFSNCTSLTTAPELPATTLADWCYSQMFRGCTNLVEITCLATDISADAPTYFWVDGVAASGTFYKAASMTNWTTGPSGIPQGWAAVNA